MSEMRKRDQTRKEKRMERNLNSKVRITEIPPEGKIEQHECPFCFDLLPVGRTEDGKIFGATAYCKRCKRRLRIDDSV